MKKVRRTLSSGIFVSAVVFIAAGTWLTAVNSLVLRPAQHYADAPTCARVALKITTENCVAMVPGIVASSSISEAGPGIERPTLTVQSTALGPAPLSVEVPRPSRSFYGLHTGQLVSLKLWQGKTTAVYPSPNDALRTSASPYISEALDLSVGLFALGIGVVLVLIHPPAPLARLLSQRTGWRRDVTVMAGRQGGLRRLWRERPLLVGLLLFLLLQVLDVATSIWGSYHGFFEGNPLALRLIDAYGPLAGLSGIKVPATVALALTLVRLPRTIAIITVYAGAAVMLFIVGQNFGLFAGSGSD